MCAGFIYMSLHLCLYSFSVDQGASAAGKVRLSSSHLISSASVESVLSVKFVYLDHLSV